MKLFSFLRGKDKPEAESPAPQETQKLGKKLEKTGSRFRKGLLARLLGKPIVDDELIETVSEPASRRLHSPQPREVAFVFDQPWEGNSCGYVTVLRDANFYRMYFKISVYYKYKIITYKIRYKKKEMINMTFIIIYYLKWLIHLKT